MGRVVVVGSINTDLVTRTAQLPRAGETVRGESFSVVGGGKGANAAVAAARLGAAVAFVGCLGDDDFGKARLADLDREAIDTTLIQRSAAAASGVALIIVDGAGENSIVVVAGTNELVDEQMIADLPLQPGDVLLTQLELPLPTVEAALRQARAAGVPTVLNAAPYNAAIADALPLVDLLVVNELEGADLLGWERVALSNSAEAVAALQLLGPGAVALTLGGAGAVVGRGEHSEYIAAPPVPVVDTTAAGDAFTGTLAAGLAAGEDLFLAAHRAVLVGSLTVTQAGAQPSLPRRDDVERFAAQLRGERQESV